MVSTLSLQHGISWNRLYTVGGMGSTVHPLYMEYKFASNYLITVPITSPIDIRIILPIVFRLKTIIGSLLSRHMAIEVASITPRARDNTSRYEISANFTASGNLSGS